MRRNQASSLSNLEHGKECFAPPRRVAVWSRLFIFLVLAGSAVARCFAAEKTARYKIVDCGPSLVRTLVNTPGLNESGSLAIWRSASGSSITGVVLRGEETVNILGKDKFSFVYPADINNAGTVVGTVQIPQDLRFTQAFRWVNGNVQLLPTLGGPYAAATAINGAGVITGSAQTAAKTHHAALWQNNTVHDLGLLERGDYSAAKDINDAGDVVGEANKTPNGKPRAFFWHSGSMRQLPDLPGGSFCSAQAINSQGLTVGSCDTAEGSSHAVLWRAGKIEDLGALGDDDSTSSALDINGHNQIVGSSEIVDGKPRAFLWETGRMINLNDAVEAKSGWLLMVASRINDRGEIVGRGFFHGSIHAFLLQPRLQEK